VRSRLHGYGATEVERKPMESWLSYRTQIIMMIKICYDILINHNNHKYPRSKKNKLGPSQNNRLISEQYEQNFADIRPPLENKTAAVVEANRCIFCYDTPLQNY
jgi:hypothetical protein